MEASEVSTRRLDHYGIVAGMCQEIDLIEQIDRMVESEGRKVSIGEAVQAMVINALGFVSRPLYLTPEFYENKPVAELIRPGIEASDLNDDSLGRALDCLYQHGVTEIFAQVSGHALNKLGIKVRYAHLDTSSFSLQGEYENEEAGEGSEPIEISYGYSKDHRPDLKQVILSLICANRSSLPVWLNVLSGNSADKTSFPETAQAYLEQFSAEEENPYLVADSALYSADNLKMLSEVRWVTRVPATINEAKQLLVTIDQSQMQPWDEAGYFLYEQPVSYAGIEQRWVVVLYEPTRQRAWQQIDKSIQREQEQATRAFKRLSRQTFACENDALAALDQLEKQWKFHRISHRRTQPVARYSKPGRPGADTSPPSFSWRIGGELELLQEVVDLAYAAAGKFIIATNDLDETRLPTVELLTLYKDQNRSVERGFRFLKDPFFFASGFFLKKPSRIAALLMVMGLSLLVYTLAELSLRQQLSDQQQSLPDQRGYPTQTPTLRRIFQVFEGIDLLYLQQDDQQQVLILNLRDIHRLILSFFGVHIRKIYGLA